MVKNKMMLMKSSKAKLPNEFPKASASTYDLAPKA